MALTFPVSLATFKALRIERIRFKLPQAVTNNTTGRGEILTVGRGVRLWEGTVTLGWHRWAEYQDAVGLLHALQEPGASFFVGPLHNDQAGFPNGTLNAVSGRDVRISGLPAGRVVTRGSQFQFQHSGRYFFYEVAQTVTADGTGLTPLMQVTPALIPGFYSVGAAGVGSTAQFSNPFLKAIIKPGSLEEPDLEAVGTAESFTFEWRQTLL